MLVAGCRDGLVPAPAAPGGPVQDVVAVVGRRRQHRRRTSSGQDSGVSLAAPAGWVCVVVDARVRARTAAALRENSDQRIQFQQVT